MNKEMTKEERIIDRLNLISHKLNEEQQNMMLESEELYDNVDMQLALKEAIEIIEQQPQQLLHINTRDLTEEEIVNYLTNTKTVLIRQGWTPISEPPEEMSMKCPFRPITTTGLTTTKGIAESTEFADCYGEECMAYSGIFIPIIKNTVHRCGLVKGDIDV